MSLISNGIEVDMDVCGGKPVVAGTRITVQTILQFMAAGDSAEEILEAYPHLKMSDIQACLSFAANLIGGTEIRVAASA